jgi:hypothetical protein
MPVSTVYACVRLLLDLRFVRSRPGFARDVELLALRHGVRGPRRRRSRPDTAPATAAIPEWAAGTRLRRAAPPHPPGHRPVRTRGHESRRKPTIRPASVGCRRSAGHPAAPSMSAITTCRSVCPGTCHSALRIACTPRLSYAELRGPQISIREQYGAAPILDRLPWSPGRSRGRPTNRMADHRVAAGVLGREGSPDPLRAVARLPLIWTQNGPSRPARAP